MEPISTAGFLIIAACIVIIVICLIIIGIYWLASSRRPDWAENLIKLGEKLKELEEKGKMSEEDCVQLRKLLEAAKDTGLPEKVGRKLGELLGELCG